MVTVELINYIRGQLSQGKAKEEIKANLLSQGWNETDINLAFSQSVVNQLATPQPSINTKVITQTQTGKPKNIFDFKNLKWYEWLAMLPAFFLLVQGGAIGAAIGFLGWGFSLKIIRSESKSKVAKIFIVVGITIAYYITYFILGSLFIVLIKGLSGK